jgi:protein TonB
MLLRAPSPLPQPPLYRVDIVAAPPGARAIGVVPKTPQPVPRAAPATPPPSRVIPPTPVPAAPIKSASKAPPSPAKATPVPAPVVRPPAAPPQTAPVAGGGPVGGQGADVATVRTAGIEFPYPGYLNNIVRQIALNFRPRNPGALRAEVQFLIHRDGSVTNVRFVTRSGSYPFDLEAQGSIEAAAASRAFGPLPQGFADDVLPVVFSFDPRVLR